MERITTKSNYKVKAALILFIFVSFVIISAIPVNAEESVLIIRPGGKGFEESVSGLKDELEGDISINEMIVDKKTSTDEFVEKMKKTAPRAVVLMDNVAIGLYKNYQKVLPDNAMPAPSVSIMASFIDLAIEELKNATGILYEVPLVTCVVNLRSIMPSQSLKKVGIVHRQFMDKAIHINRTYCAKENIELVSFSIPNKADFESDIKNGLKALEEKNIDALWVPNDSSMLTSQLLQSVWIPFVKKLKKPVIAGVEVLVTPKFQFGTFALIPDHIRLGEQAASLIFTIKENNWAIEESKTYPPRSVYKILNLKQSQDLFGVNKDKLGNVDKILE